MKAMQRYARIMGLLLVATTAGELVAQGNTQRPLRPGQVRGPKFMVPVLKSNERALSVQVADVIRDRLMSDNLATTIYVVPKSDIVTSLESSGYSVTEALGPNDLKALAQLVQAEEWLDGTVTKNDDGSLTLRSTMNIQLRQDGMVQPLPDVSGGRPGDIAAKVSDEIEKARKQIEPVKKCMDAMRASNYDEALEQADRAIKAYGNSVYARVCQLETEFRKKSGPDPIIKVAEEILAIHPENKQALIRVADQYFEKIKADKSFEDKYISTLTKLLAADPTNTQLQEGVVNALAQAGKPDIAKPIIDEAVKQNPGDPSLIRLQWNIYRTIAAKNKDWKGAIAVGEEMIKHDTAAADTTFYNVLVGAYVADSQLAKAQEAAARGAAKFPRNPGLWLTVAQLARQNGQIPQALEAINRVLAIDPKYPGVYLQKAAIFSEQNQIDSLQATLRLAVDNGADKATAGGMILSKGNQLFQAYQRDTAKTVEQGEYVLSVLAFADTLNPTETTSFLMGANQLLLGQALLTRASANKSCDDSKRANDLLIGAQGLIQKGGRAFPQAAGQAMQGAMQLQQFADRSMKALCK